MATRSITVRSLSPLSPTSERFLPKSWLAPNGLDVTDDFIRYVRPLIGEGLPPLEFESGVLRFARLTPAYAPKRCASYVPQNYRG